MLPVQSTMLTRTAVDVVITKHSIYNHRLPRLWMLPLRNQLRPQGGSVALRVRTPQLELVPSCVVEAPSHLRGALASHHQAWPEHSTAQQQTADTPGLAQQQTTTIISWMWTSVQNTAAVLAASLGGYCDLGRL
jgi:hypothetical protein